MKKRLIVIATLILLIFICLIFYKMSNKNNVKMDFKVNQNITQLVSDYTVDFLYLIQQKKYEVAYSKLYEKDFSGIEAFEIYCSNRLIADDSGILVQDVKDLKNGEYLVTVRIFAPLFTSNELEEKENYKTKNIEIKFKFNGLFDYNINMKEQYDG